MSGDAEAQSNDRPRSFRQLGSHPAFSISSWIFCSSLTVLLNKWLMSTVGFTITLTSWHLLFASLVTQLLSRTTPLLDARRTAKITGRLYLRAVVPAALAHAAALACTNLALARLSLALATVLRAAWPVASLLAAWALGLDNPPLRRALYALAVLPGVALAVVARPAGSDSDSESAGLLFGAGAVVLDALHAAVAAALLLSSGDGAPGAGAGVGLDPLVALYYTAPVSAAATSLAALAVEWRAFDPADLARAGLLTLLASAVASFVLAVAGAFVTTKTSKPTISTASLLRDFLLIAASVIVWRTHLTPPQLLGYALACVAVVHYSLGWEQMAARSAAGWAYAREVAAAEPDEVRRSLAARKSLVVALAATAAGLLTVGYVFSGAGASVAMSARAG